jgi:KUP system potassium uptake protein
VQLTSVGAGAAAVCIASPSAGADLLLLLLRLLALNCAADIVVGISVAVLVLLFITQSYDTSLVGRTLAPTVVIWLSLNAGVGIYNLAVNGGEILTSLNPWQIVGFFARNGRAGWLMLGGVVLCITGTEAMYADLGHFTRRSVSVSILSYAQWLCLQQ